MVMASLAALLARSLPGMAEWPGIHWMKIEDDMDLWNGGLRMFEGWMRRELHAKAYCLQKSMEIEWWLALVDVQDSADSMAAASSL